MGLLKGKIMKRIRPLLLTILLFISSYSSGLQLEVELSTRISKEHSTVFVVTLIDFTQVEIEEFNKVADGIRKFATIVEVAAIIHTPESKSVDEQWQVAFNAESTKPLAKYRVWDGKSIVGDTVIVMNGDDIERSYSYYVEERKNFSYYYTTQAAETPLLTKRNYIFISNGSPSFKNGVYLGNIGYGFYPDSEEIRRIVRESLK